MTSSALKALLRRDMSLNKRLFSWLLGPDPTEEAQVRYFLSKGKGLVVGSIKGMLAENDGPPTIPYRVALSLLDKWEIGTVIVPDILPPMLSSLASSYSSSSPVTKESEVRLLLLFE